MYVLKFSQFLILKFYVTFLHFQPPLLFSISLQSIRLDYGFFSGSLQRQNFIWTFLLLLLLMVHPMFGADRTVVVVGCATFYDYCIHKNTILYGNQRAATPNTKTKCKKLKIKLRKHTPNKINLQQNKTIL